MFPKKVCALEQADNVQWIKAWNQRKHEWDVCAVDVAKQYERRRLLLIYIMYWTEAQGVNK